MKHYKKENPKIDFYFWSSNNWCIFLGGNVQVFYYYQNANHISCGNTSFENANNYYDSYNCSLIWTLDAGINGYHASYKYTKYNQKTEKGISKYVLYNMRYLLNKYNNDLSKIINKMKQYIPPHTIQNMDSKYPAYHL